MKHKFTGTLLSLCLAAATHSFLLFSFYPYAGYMAVTLLNNNGEDGITVNNVGMYAGMLGTTFTLGRFMGFVPWKYVRNQFGGKTALILSLLLTGLSSIWVGLAETFTGALMARFFQGLSNCISGCVKRATINARYDMMSERMIEKSKRYNSSRRQEGGEIDDDSHNPTAIILSIMWWGTALGPIAGGLFSDPRFLNKTLGLDMGLMSHPYLLSNAISAILCWLSMICVGIFVKDTPSRISNGEKPQQISMSTGESRPLLTPASSSFSSTSTTTAGSSSWLDIFRQKESGERLWHTFLKLWRTNEASRWHLSAYWLFSFVVVCCDEALPLFLITSKSKTGLGLSEGQIGAVLSTAGIVVAVNHHLSLERLFDIEHGSKDGLYRILGFCALFGNVTAVLTPITILLNSFYKNGNDGITTTTTTTTNLLGLTTSSFLFLVALIIFVRSAVGFYFTFIGVAFGQTLRVVHKDEAARIMTIGALFFRSWAPIVAGCIVSFFMSESYEQKHTALVESSPLHPSWMVWIVIGLVFGMVAAWMTSSLARYHGDGVVLTAKHRKYLMARLHRMTSLRKSVVDVWDDKHDVNSTAVKLYHWVTAFFHGPQKKKKKTKSSSSVDDPTTQVIKKSIDESTTMSKRITWAEHVVGPGVDFDKITFFILGTHKNNKACAPHVLTPPLMNALQKHLPENVAQSNFWLRYSLLRDGANMHTIEAKAGFATYSVLAIETLCGNVFGCFMNKPWVSSNNHYRRAGESFLWRMTTRRLVDTDTESSSTEYDDATNDTLIEVYPYSGKNDLCQLFADDKIACGGGVVVGEGDGFGILLEDDLLSGSTSPCETYDNPSLVGKVGCCDSHDDDNVNGSNNSFEVANIEIWSFTSYMFVSDAERGEQALQFKKDNSFETPSGISPWSHFM